MHLFLFLSISLSLASTAVSSTYYPPPFIHKCRDAPTPAREFLCEQLQHMDNRARARHAIIPPEKPPAVILHPAYECQNITCLCPYFHGTVAKDESTCILRNGKKLERAVRKEIRHFSEGERERYHHVLNNLKRSGEYQRLGRMHTMGSQQGGVHAGPAFLLWHREFLKRMEIAVRLLDPDLALPYWDSVLDQNLPDARDSVLWSPAFYGESDIRGHVKNGPFVNWQTIEGNPQIHREVGLRETLFTETHLRIIQSQPSVLQVMGYTAPRIDCPVQPDWDIFEYLHGNPHLWVGGDMVDPETSVNDPVFYQHHAFVDLIWENWRLIHQNRSLRETEYPPNDEDCSNVQHFSDAQMYPFSGLHNRDGLSNHYTESMYTFAPRPNCSTSKPDCGSPYLFCDTAHIPPRCVSKAREGGRCDGFENMDICYASQCSAGRCVSYYDQSAIRLPQSRQLGARFDDDKENYQNNRSILTTALSITAGLGLVVGILWTVLPLIRRQTLGKPNMLPLLDAVKEKLPESSSILNRRDQINDSENIKKYGSTPQMLF